MSGSRSIITLWALLIAWIMFITAISRRRLRFGERCVALLGEVPGQLGEHVLEHALDIVAALLGQDAELLGFLLRGADLDVDRLGQRRVALLVPFAERR